MDDFCALAKKRYDEIEKKETETRQKLEALAAEKAPLTAYLIKADIIKAKTRKRKAAPASTGAA